MLRILKNTTLALGVSLALAGQALAVPTVLPNPTTPPGYAIQYDQFYSYSTHLLTAWGVPGYDFSTGTGGLDLVIGTGANGASNSSVGLGGAFAFPDPMSTPGGGSDQTFSGIWGPTGSNAPVTVDYLLSYLHSSFGNDVNVPVFYFDMTEPGNGGKQNLDVVGQVFIKNGASTVASWAFDNIANGVFDDPNTNPNAWVNAPGSITAPNPLDPLGPTYTVPNNLGNGKPDFIVYAPTMDLTAYTGLGYTIEMDFMMRKLDGSFEELFLTGAFQPHDAVATPEPGTLALMGIGALGAAFARRRKAG